MHSGRKCVHSALSHFTGPFSMHIGLYVWMLMASGLTLAFQASDAQAVDPSQLTGLPSNLPVTSANDKTRRNGYRNAAAYWQWQLQFTGKERLISSEQLPFPLRERKRQAEAELETTCPDRSLYSVLTHSPSARVLYFETLNVSSGCKGPELSNKKANAGKDWIKLRFWKVYMWTFQHFKSNQRKQQV